METETAVPSDAAVLEARNAYRLETARRLWSIPLSRVALTRWCETGHDMVTWRASYGDRTCCWYCGRPT